MAKAYSSPPFIPMGFKFRPSDEELVHCYLIPKVTKRVLPIDLIYEVELKNYNPEDLAGIFYINFISVYSCIFFVHLRKYSRKNVGLL